MNRVMLFFILILGLMYLLFVLIDLFYWNPNETTLENNKIKHVPEFNFDNNGNFDFLAEKENLTLLFSQNITNIAFFANKIKARLPTHWNLIYEVGNEKIGFVDGYNKAIQQVNTIYAAIISPYTIDWDEESVQSLSTLFNRSMLLNLPSLGSATIDNNREWFLNCHKIIHKHWRFKITEYTLGYPSSLGRNVKCDYSSLTRVIKSKILKNLFSVEMEGSWFVDIDMKLKENNIPSYISVDTLFKELKSNEMATLSPLFAIKYQVERVHFSVSNKHTYCHFLESPVTVSKKVSLLGLVMPYCQRKGILEAMSTIVSSWTNFSSTNIVVIKSGTALSAIRGTKLSPWEYDFDLLLLYKKESKFTYELGESKLRVHLENLGYKFRKAGDWGWFAVSHPGKKVVYLDAILGVYEEKDLNEMLIVHRWGHKLYLYKDTFSTLVKYYGDTYLERRDRNWEKGFSSFDLIRCKSPGHNACLPNCTDPNNYCDMPNEFDDIS